MAGRGMWRRALCAALLVVAGLLILAAPVAASRPTQDTGNEAITARLFDVSGKEEKPVVGVRVVVRKGEAKIGEAVSDAKGVAGIPVPGRGTYQVRLDEKTFPKGVGKPAQTVLPNVIVQSGRAKFVLFPFGESFAKEPSDIDQLADLAGNGLRIGLIIAVAAVGLSLVFGTTGLINFAQGELVTFGGIAAWYLNANSGGLGLTLVVAGILAAILGGLFGGGLELGLWRPLRRRRTGNVALMVVSIGLALFLRSVFQIVFGAAPQSYSQYAVQETWRIGPLDILPKSVAVIAICVVILVAVALCLLRTRLGTAVRAVTDNADLAESSGIDVQRVILVVWIACGALAAAAGVLLGMVQTVEYDMGFKILLVIFAAMILGGLGSAFGAMVGGIVLGLAYEVSTFWIPTDFKYAVALGVLILVLLVRPQGILGVKERVA
jgi:neutral amino acid transport system permease protein